MAAAEATATRKELIDNLTKVDLLVQEDPGNEEAVVQPPRSRSLKQ